MDEGNGGYARNHLLITSQHVVRGTVVPCPGRLSDVLRRSARRWLPVEDAEITPLVSVAQASPRTIPGLRLSRSSVLLAHEYVALGGDRHQRTRDQEVPSLAVTVVFEPLPGVTLHGRLREKKLEKEEQLLVLFEAEIAGMGEDARALAATVSGLPYLLVNLERAESVIVSPT